MKSRHQQFPLVMESDRLFIARRSVKGRTNYVGYLNGIEHSSAPTRQAAIDALYRRVATLRAA